MMESVGVLSNVFFPGRQFYPILHFPAKNSSSPRTHKIKPTNLRPPKILCCYSNLTSVTAPQTEQEADAEESTPPPLTGTVSSPPGNQKRIRYRKLYPGEKDGITEEMRFVAMKLRNSGKPKKKRIRKKIFVENMDEIANGGSEIDEIDNGISVSGENSDGDGNGNEEIDEDDNGISVSRDEDSTNSDENGETWEPTMDGFLKYLVDSKLVFSTIERIIDQSDDAYYAYFRKTGLERTECLSKDIEFLSRQEEGNRIPEASNPGISYSKYLEELGEKSPSLFLSHLYNIYFSHIAAGQLIAKRVSEQLLDGRELGFCKWEGEEEESLRELRENLNTLSKDWTRDEKNKCLKETTKAFRFLGQIVGLIVL